MAKVKIGAGVEFEAVTSSEMKDVIHGSLKSWSDELRRGKKFRRILASPVAIAANAVSITYPGPEEGFVWAIRRITVTGLSGTDTVSIFVNGSNAGDIVVPGVAVSTAYQRFGSNDFILTSGDSIVIAGGAAVTGSASMAGTGNINFTGQVCEVPHFSAWML